MRVPPSCVCKQAQSFSAATRKADALWSELSTYQPPSIQHLLPAQTPEMPPGGSEGDCCMADSPVQVGSGGKAGAREEDGQAPGGEDVPASEVGRVGGWVVLPPIQAKPNAHFAARTP